MGRFRGCVYCSHGQSPDWGDEDSSYNSVNAFRLWDPGHRTQFTHEKLNHWSRCPVSSLAEKILIHWGCVT